MPFRKSLQRVGEWGVSFPRSPNVLDTEGFRYEYVKLYAAECPHCEYEYANPSRANMRKTMIRHMNRAHGTPVIRQLPLG